MVLVCILGNKFNPIVFFYLTFLSYTFLATMFFLHACVFYCTHAKPLFSHLVPAYLHEWKMSKVMRKEHCCFSKLYTCRLVLIASVAINIRNSITNGIVKEYTDIILLLYQMSAQVPVL